MSATNEIIAKSWKSWLSELVTYTHPAQAVVLIRPHKATISGKEVPGRRLRR